MPSGIMSRTTSTRGVSTPPTRVGTTTTSASSRAFASSRSWPGGVSTTATASASTVPIALRSSRSVGASTSSIDASASSSRHVEPVGRAGLRVGVDERRLAPARGGERCQVHGGGGLAHPALQRSHHDDHTEKVPDLPGRLSPPEEPRRPLGALVPAHARDRVLPAALHLLQGAFVCGVTALDHLVEVPVLRLDHLVGGLSVELELACPTQLVARHRLHAEHGTKTHPSGASPILLGAPRGAVRVAA